MYRWHSIFVPRSDRSNRTRKKPRQHSETGPYSGLVIAANWTTVRPVSCRESCRTEQDVWSEAVPMVGRPWIPSRLQRSQDTARAAAFFGALHDQVPKISGPGHAPRGNKMLFPNHCKVYNFITTRSSGSSWNFTLGNWIINRKKKVETDHSYAHQIHSYLTRSISNPFHKSNWASVHWTEANTDYSFRSE
jgi:hypothetical protein